MDTARVLIEERRESGHQGKVCTELLLYSILLLLPPLVQGLVAVDDGR